MDVDAKGLEPPEFTFRPEPGAPNRPPEEGLVGLGRDVAHSAARLARAEVAVAKAQLMDTLKGAAVGLGLVVTGLVAFLLFLVFLVATLDEGVRAEDSWPLYGAIAGLLIGGALLTVAATIRVRAVGMVCRIVGMLGMIGFVGLLVTFLVVAIIADAPEQARRGWAITTLGLFIIGVGAAGAGGMTLYKDWKATIATVGSLKEDVAWVKHLTKRDSNES